MSFCYLIWRRASQSVAPENSYDLLSCQKKRWLLLMLAFGFPESMSSKPHAMLQAWGGVAANLPIRKSPGGVDQQSAKYEPKWSSRPMASWLEWEVVWQAGPGRWSSPCTGHWWGQKENNGIFTKWEIPVHFILKSYCMCGKESKLICEHTLKDWLCI